MRPAKYATVALCVALLLPALLSPVAASPTPSPVCGVCGQEFERTIHEASGDELEITVVRSTVDIQVHEDGSATFVARNRLNESSADRLQNRSALVDRAVRSLLQDHPLAGRPHPTSDHSVRDVSTELQGDTVVVRFTVPDVADQSMGVLLVDGFFETSHTRLVVGAERMTLHVPEGYRVANDPPAADHNASTVTWIGSSRGYSDENLTDQTFVVLAPDGAPAGAVQGQLAIAAATFPMYVEHVTAATLIPALGLLGVLLGYRWLAGKVDADREPARVAAGVAVGGLVLLALGTVWPGGLYLPRALNLLSLVGTSYLLVGGVITGIDRTGDDGARGRFTLRRLVGLGVVSVLVSLLLVVGLQSVLAPERTVGATLDHVYRLLSLALVLQPVLFASAGYARRIEDRRSEGTLTAAIVLALPLSVLPLVPIGGFGPVFYALVFAFWVVVLALIAFPAYYLGLTLARSEAADRNAQSSTG